MSEETDIKPTESEGGFTATCGSDLERLLTRLCDELEAEGARLQRGAGNLSLHEDNYQVGLMCCALATCIRRASDIPREESDEPPFASMARWIKSQNVKLTGARGAEEKPSTKD